MGKKKGAGSGSASGEEKVRELKEYLDAHPEVWVQIRENIAAGERGEGVPARIVHEEARRRDEERRQEEERRRRRTKPST